MTDRIEKMLSIALQDANKALGEARRSVRVIEADANEIERLLSLHLQSKQVEAATTQAWDPALVANGSGPNRTVPDRSAPPIDQTQVVPAQPWSQEDAWKPLMGQRITVSYADGSTVTGVLEDTSYRRYRLTDVPGYPADEVYVGSLASVTGVVPAQDASAPLCKNCGKPIAIDRQDDWFHIDADGGTYACYPDAVISTDAEPSPPPADQPTPPGRPLPDSDPTQRVDVTEAQGGAS